MSGAALLAFAEEMVKRVSSVVGGGLICLQCGVALVEYYERYGYLKIETQAQVVEDHLMVKHIDMDIAEDGMWCSNPSGSEDVSGCGTP